MAVTGTPTAGELDTQLRAVYTALGGVGEPETVTLPWTPPVKARPRFAKGGRAYQDPKDRDAEQRTRAMLLYRTRRRFECNVVVVAAFCRHDKRWTDVDNCMKHLLDSANGVIFCDDAQVTAQAGIMEHAPGAPRTVVLVGEHASSMPRDIPASSPRRKRPRGA